MDSATVDLTNQRHPRRRSNHVTATHIYYYILLVMLLHDDLCDGILWARHKKLLPCRRTRFRFNLLVQKISIKCECGCLRTIPKTFLSKFLNTDSIHVFLEGGAGDRKRRGRKINLLSLNRPSRILPSAIYIIPSPS